MTDKETPEAGTRCRVELNEGQELAVWTGHMWATEDGSRILEGAEIKSWEKAPHEGELEIRKEDEDS